jgi:hypothetical protein
MAEGHVGHGVAAFGPDVGPGAATSRGCALAIRLPTDLGIEAYIFDHG